MLYKGPGGGMVGMGCRDETVGMEPQGDRERGERPVYRDQLGHRDYVDHRDHVDHKVCSLTYKDDH